MDYFYSAAGIVLFGLIVGGGVMWVRNRDLRMRESEEAAERAFERTLGHGMGTAGLSEAKPYSMLTGAAPEFYQTQGQGAEESESISGRQEAEASARDEEDGTPLNEHGAEDAASSEDLELVDLIREKLKVAGAFDYDDGAIRSSDPALQGTILKLKNGKRVAVIESGLAEESPGLHAMLAMVDAAIARGPEGRPLHVKRFEDFLGELLSL